MKLSMKSLAALLMMLNGAVMASENVNTPENRQFLKQQENLSRQLREKPDHQLKAWAEKQVLETPLQRSDNHFLDELVRKQQASQDGKPRQGALYFVSFSIPEEGLKRMLGETRHYGIPATLRGMVNNDLKTTAEAVLPELLGIPGHVCHAVSRQGNLSDLHRQSCLYPGVTPVCLLLRRRCLSA